MSIVEPDKISVTVSRAEFDATTVTISVAEYAALCRLRDAAARCANVPVLIGGRHTSYLWLLIRSHENRARTHSKGQFECDELIRAECARLADEIERHRCEPSGEPKRCGEVGE